MQTAVQKLEQQLKDVLGDMFINFALEQEFEQAKEMEKQQIIDAANIKKEDRWFDAKLYNNCGEKYYTETYGSKGSDKHIVDTNEMVSSQTEISDEEINKKAMDILKDRWSHLYLDGYPKKPFPINYQHDLDTVMLGIYKSQQLSDKKPMRFHCVPKEISDEEILEESNYRFRHFEQSKKEVWANACKWYREQLKKKQ